MKTFVAIVFGMITLVALLLLGQNSFAQNKNEVTANSLKAEVSSARFLLGEPIPVQFCLVLSSPERTPKIVEGMKAKVTSGTTVREFEQFSPNISMGEPQPLPRTSVTAGPLFPNPPAPIPEQRSFGETETIYSVLDLFPTPGDYLVQFEWKPAAISSNLIAITIEEPTGLSKKAYDEMRTHSDFYSFEWVHKEKDGFSSLERFVANYGDSPYGSSAINYLANVYVAKDQLDKAEKEFVKLTSSSDPGIAQRAKEALALIANQRAASVKSQ